MTTAILALLLGAMLLWFGIGVTRRGLGRAPAPTAQFGPILEGLAVALVAAAQGDTPIAAGVAFGTLLVLVAVGFGTSLLLARQPAAAAAPATVVLPAATLVAAAFTVTDQAVSRIEGLGLLVVYGAYLLLREPEAEPPPPGREGNPRTRPFGSGRLRPLWPVVGLIAAYAGARFILGGGHRILDHGALLAGFVGAAVLAPAAAARLVLQGLSLRSSGATPVSVTLDALAAGATAMLGAAAIVRPLVVDAAASYAFVAVVAVYAVTAVVLLALGRAWRITGFVVLGLYGLWLALASMT